MGLKLKWAMFITFFVLALLLSAVFWAVMWALNVTGTALIVGVFCFVGFMIFIQWLIGPAIIKSLSHAQPCTDSRVLKIVYELAGTAKIPRPAVYIVNNPLPNAFAFGRTQKSSAIALHTGLLETLTEDEIRGVVAHEIGHIKHRDVAVMTLAAALPAILYYIVYFATIAASSRREGGGGVNYFGAWIGGMIAQFIGFLLVMYLSRVREYSADARSAYLTRKPLGLANALEKISAFSARCKSRPVATLRTFYIYDPSANYAAEMGRGSAFLEIFSTHPLTHKRIAVLKKIEQELS